MPTVLDLDAIKAILPHRDRALMLDRVEIQDDGSIVGHFTPRTEHFEGHVPGYPVLPGKELPEVMMLALAVGASRSVPEGHMAYNGGYDGVRFRGQVRPGDVIRVVVRITQQSSRGIKGMGEAYVTGREKPVAVAKGLLGVIGPKQQA